MMLCVGDGAKDGVSHWVGDGVELGSEAGVHPDNPRINSVDSSRVRAPTGRRKAGLIFRSRPFRAELKLVTVLSVVSV